MATRLLQRNFDSRVMGYRLLVFFLILNLVYWSKAQITCYECTMSYFNHISNETVKRCSKFEETKEYEQSCPYSTFCMKKTSELFLDGKTIRVEERRCAPQTSKQHKLINNTWVIENVVEKTIYKEGCSPEQSLDLKVTKIEYCYCSSDYCNSSKRSVETTLFHHTDAMSVIFIFNVVKLMRSVR